MARPMFAHGRIIISNADHRGRPYLYRNFRWLKRPTVFDSCPRSPHTLHATLVHGPPEVCSLHASAMKPAPFKYIAATSLQQALSLKVEHGDEAKFLAGGQSLMPAMNFRLAQPAILIDINQIEELAGIRLTAGAAARIGALTRYHRLER